MREASEILPGTGRGTSEAGGGDPGLAANPDRSPLHRQPATGGPPPRAGEEFALSDPAATEAFGASLASLVRPGDVVTLSGPLGAGKTSVARGLLAALGLAGEAPSPSFAIVQPYDPPEVRLPVLHVDLYRIDDPDELEELGLEDAGDAVLLVEWPERAPGWWPHALALSLAATPAGGRALTVAVPPAWEGRWPT